MKRTSLSLLTGLFVFLLAGMVFTSCEEDDGTTPKAEITSFAIVNAGADGETTIEGTIEQTSITVGVPYKTDLTQLVPQVELTKNAEVTPSSGDTLDFSEPRNFVVTNGDLENTYQVTVNKQDPTGPVLKALDVTSVTTQDVYDDQIDQGAATVSVTYNELQSSTAVLKNVEVGPQGATYTTSSGSDTVDLANEPAIKVGYQEDTMSYTLTSEVTPAGLDTSSASIIMDMTAASQSVPTGIQTQDSRGAAYNGDYVFAASLEDGKHIYYWEVGSSVTERQELAGIDSVSGGTFPVSDVHTVGDAIYVSNMVMNAGGVFKVYKWDNVDDDDPEVVLQYEVGQEERLGDALSIVGDPTQDGFITSPNFPGFGGETDNNKFYVWHASGGELTSEPEVWDVQVESGRNLGQYGKMNAIPGADGMYVASGAEMGVAVVNSNGEGVYEVPTSLIPFRAQDPTIFKYNDGVYLSYVVNQRAWNGARYQIVNITEGSDPVAGLKNLSAANINDKIVYSKKFSGGENVQTINSDNEVVFDENGDPTIFSFTVTDGFLIEKFTK
mgnify:CR=1 FL=1